MWRKLKRKKSCTLLSLSFHYLLYQCDSTTEESLSTKMEKHTAFPHNTANLRSLTEQLKLNQIIFLHYCISQMANNLQCFWTLALQFLSHVEKIKIKKKSNGINWNQEEDHCNQGFNKKTYETKKCFLGFWD